MGISIRAYHMEWIKLFKRKSSRVLMGLYGLIVLALGAMYLLGESNLGVNLFTGGQFMGASLTFTMGLMLPFIALYLSSTSFALDFGKGTIKNMFLLPLRKDQIFLGKLLAVQSLLGILLVVQFTISLVLGLFLEGWMGFGILGSQLLVYGGAFLALGLLNLLAALVSLMVSSSGLAILISYVALVAMNLLDNFVPRLRVISLPTLLAQYDMVMSRVQVGQLLSFVAYYILLFMVGYLLFEKKDEGSCQFE